MTQNTSKVGWIPIIGDFQVNDEKISFCGQSIVVPSPDSPPSPEKVEYEPFGKLMSSHRIADGTVSAEVEFEQVSEQSTCQLVVAYDDKSLHIVCAGIGGARNAMFAIREYNGPIKGDWSYPVIGGSHSGIRPNVKYNLKAVFRGAHIALSIDGVAVGSAFVTSPSGRPRQVGIFCQGRHAITIRNFVVENQKPIAFVVMQFGNEYDNVYRDVVEKVCTGYKIRSLRADELVGPGLVIADIINEIASAQLIIADITPANPNVYFEVGYSLALMKPTILLARKGTPLPFDVAGLRVLFYED